MGAALNCQFHFFTWIWSLQVYQRQVWGTLFGDEVLKETAEDLSPLCVIPIQPPPWRWWIHSITTGNRANGGGAGCWKNSEKITGSLYFWGDGIYFGWKNSIGIFCLSPECHNGEALVHLCRCGDVSRKAVRKTWVFTSYFRKYAARKTIWNNLRLKTQYKPSY